MKELYENLEIFGKFQWITGALFSYQVMTNGFLMMLPTFTQQEMAHTCAGWDVILLHENEKYVSRDTFKNFSKGNPDAKDYWIESSSSNAEFWRSELGRDISGCRNFDGSFCEHLIYTNGKDMVEGQATVLSEFDLVCKNKDQAISPMV